MIKCSVFLILILLLSVTVSEAQYIWMETKLTCDKARLSTLTEARQKFKPLMDGLVKEGSLVNWDSGQEVKGDKVELRYYLTVNAGDDGKIFNEYWRRASVNSPELYKAFVAACPVRKDTVTGAVMYPLLKENIWEGVAAVPHIDEVPDPKLTYNVVVDFTAISLTEKKKTDSVSINWGLQEVGRNINLHIAAGIPRNKINFVVAVHGGAVRSFYTNEAYQKKYKQDNPNLAVIKELSAAGVKFLLCGQSLNWLKIDRSMLLPEARIALTAQTVLTTYQLKGYALKQMYND
jgi:intracellular sulfur oxidation DsrE/DsrF family protein